MPDRIAPPEVPGHRLERVLGKGGMGTVWLATQCSLDRPVAVKVLHAHRVRQPGEAEAFLAEAVAAGRLRHPALVAVYEVFHDPSKHLHAYSMEYVPGRTAADLVDEGGPLPRPFALHIVLQAAGALAVAHAQGLVHRDVKPENLIVTPERQVKLLDLGLVYNRTGGLAPAPQVQGKRRLVLLGTPEYGAPEQSRRPDEAHPTADVWSLGATLYHLLVGHPPFDGETVLDLLISAAVDPLELPAELDRECRVLLGHLLAKDPADRYQDAAQAGAAIKAVAAGHPAPPPKPSGINRRPLRRRLG